MRMNFSGTPCNWHTGYVRLERTELFDQTRYRTVVQSLASYIGEAGITELNRMRGTISGEMSRGAHLDTDGLYVSYRRGYPFALGPLHIGGMRAQVQIAERLVRLPNGSLQRIPL